LQEVPPVAVEIFEDGNGAVGFLAGTFQEADAAGLIGVVVSPEIVGVEEQKDTAAGLIADGAGLFGSGGFGEEQGGAARVWRGDEEPAFVVRQGGIFEELEAKLMGEEGEGFVVVADDQREMRDGLRHDLLSFHRKSSLTESIIAGKARPVGI
jgi:hypothetical protein